MAGASKVHGRPQFSSVGGGSMSNLRRSETVEETTTCAMSNALSASSIASGMDVISFPSSSEMLLASRHGHQHLLTEHPQPTFHPGIGVGSTIIPNTADMAKHSAAYSMLSVPSAGSLRIGAGPGIASTSSLVGVLPPSFTVPIGKAGSMEAYTTQPLASELDIFTALPINGLSLQSSTVGMSSTPTIEGTSSHSSHMFDDLTLSMLVSEEDDKDGNDHRDLETSPNNNGEVGTGSDGSVHADDGEPDDDLQEPSRRPVNPRLSKRERNIRACRNSRRRRKERMETMERKLQLLEQRNYILERYLAFSHAQATVSGLPGPMAQIPGLLASTSADATRMTRIEIVKAYHAVLSNPKIDGILKYIHPNCIVVGESVGEFHGANTIFHGCQHIRATFIEFHMTLSDIKALDPKGDRIRAEWLWKASQDISKPLLNGQRPPASQMSGDGTYIKFQSRGSAYYSFAPDNRLNFIVILTKNYDYSLLTPDSIVN